MDPHPLIVTIGDNRDDIRVLLYFYYITITGWGGPPKGYHCSRPLSIISKDAKVISRPYGFRVQVSSAYSPP